MQCKSTNLNNLRRYRKNSYPSKSLFYESSSVSLKSLDIRTALTRGRTESCSSISSCRSIVSLPDSLTNYTTDSSLHDTVPKILDYKMVDNKVKRVFMIYLLIRLDQLGI